jgi:autotransporter-associated beta strand protein
MTNQRTLITLLATCTALSFAANVSAANITKDNNANNLNLGSSWLGGTPPTSSDIAVWDSTVTSVITNALGQDTNWGGIQILSPGGAVFINADVSPVGITVVANSPTLTYTNAPANPLVNGDRAYLGGTTAPTGFTFGIGTVYYVVNATATTFQLSATPGGPAITPTTAGSAVNVAGPFLTVGASGVDGSAASQTLTFNCPVAMTNFSGNAIWNLSQNVFLNGGLVGTNTLEKQGGATLFIGNGQSGPGSVIQVDSGIVQANSSSGTLIALNGGTFNVNVADGNPINVMAGGGIEQNVGGNRTWSGALTGSGPLSVVASAIHTWNGNNAAYSGTLTESGGGSLRLSSVNSVSASTAYIINGTMNGNATGIFNLGSLAGSGTVGIASGTPTWSIGALNANSDFTGAIVGAAAIVVKTGTGIQNLSGANTYAGITVISNGVLQIGDGGSAGSLASSAVFVTNGTSVLSFNRGDAALDFTNIITGIGTLSSDGNGTVFLSGPSGGTAANQYSGGTVLNGGTLKFATGALGNGGITFNNNATLQWATGNTTDISSNTVTINSGGTIDVNGNAVTLTNSIGNSGTGALSVKSTGVNGVLNLLGANTYSGGTTVSTGTLRANNTTGSATGSGNVTVSTGAILGGAGSVSGLADIQGILSPGNSTVGTLTVGSLTLEPGGTNNFQFNATPANSGVIVTTSGGFTVNGGLFNFYSEGSTTPWMTAGTYHLIQFSGAAPSLDSSWTTSSSSNPHVANPQPGLQYAFSASGGFLSVTITVSSGAVVGTWNVDANGNWSDATKWSSNPRVPHAAGDSATFGTGAALRTVTLDANESVGALTMNNNNSFVIASAGKTLTLDNSGSGASVNVSGGAANNIQTAVALNDNAMVTVTSGKTLSVSGTIANSSAVKTLTVSGPGTLALSGNNSYGPAAGAAGTILNGATLQVGNNNALGVGDVSIPANGTLQAGANGLTISNNVDVVSGVTATLDDNGNTLTLGGVISDSGNLNKIGGGKVALSGTNTYSGNTTVSAGVLSLSADVNVGASPNVILNGGLLLGGTLDLDGSHNIGIGLASGGIGTNALIDAASGQTFQVDGIIGTAGNLGANNLIVNSLPGDNGTLVLNGANTFNGTTSISNGVLQVLNSLALQDSTLVYNSGTLAVDGSLSTVTLGGLAGTNNLVLTNLSGGVVVWTIGNNGGNATYSGGLNDFGVGSAVTKNGTGMFTLSGSNSYTGATTLAGGTLVLTNGGQIVSAGTVTINGGVGGVFNVSGGSLSAAGAVFNDNNPGFIQNSGASSFTNNVGFATDNADNNTAMQILGGTFSANSLNSGRTALNLSAQPAAGQGPGGIGIYISNAVVTITNTLGVGGRSSGANSSTSMRLDGGTLNVGGTTTITLNNGGRWSVLDINGGTFTSTDTNAGVQIGGVYAGANGLFLVRAGTASVNQITFGDVATQASGTDVLNLTGGTLYIGAGGMAISNPAPTFGTSITMSGGTVGALSNWSSSLPITLVSNIVTFQTADSANNPQNITLSGVLSGNGGITKTGVGTLTLSGVNTYTNDTVVSAGTLDLLTASLFTNSIMSVSNGATLKLDFAGANVVAGLVLNGVSKPPGTYNHGTDPAFLAGAGSIRIIAIGPKPTPFITHIGVSGTTLTITGTNGAPGGPYVLLQSTNLTTPLTNWTPAVSNSFDGSGNLNLSTNIVTPGIPREFYILLQ